MQDIDASIQSGGFLLATDMHADTITHVSENSAEFVGISPEQLVGSDASDLLGPNLVHAIRNSAGHSTIRTRREYITTTSVAGAADEFNISLYAANNRLILEFVPASEDEGGSIAVLATVYRAIDLINTVESVDELVDLAVGQLRHFSGYDRVKLFRFLPDQSSEVCAESRTPGVSSLLGLRSPTSTAQTMDVRTPIYVNKNLDAPQCRIMCGDGEPLDLGLAHFRAISAAAAEYLAAIGVRATVSLTVVVQGEVWGVFGFHHHESRAPSRTDTDQSPDIRAHGPES